MNRHTKKMLREMFTTATTSALAMTLFLFSFLILLVLVVKALRRSFKCGVGSCPVAAAWSITQQKILKSVLFDDG